MADDANLEKKISGGRLKEFKQLLDQSYVTKAAVTAALGMKLSKEDVVNLLWPVGSIYLSAKSTNPAGIFGVGTWKQLDDAFRYAWERIKDAPSGNLTVNYSINSSSIVTVPDDINILEITPDGQTPSYVQVTPGAVYQLFVYENEDDSTKLDLKDIDMDITWATYPKSVTNGTVKYGPLINTIPPTVTYE